MSNSWDPITLPPGYAYGFSGGPEFDVRIRSTDGGEFRLQVRDEPTWRWSALRRNFGDDADVGSLIDFFLARRGNLYGFLFLDPRDFSTAEDHASEPTELDQLIGVGDGTTTRFRLRKQYRDPGGMTARDFPRRVVPLLGTASEAVAKILNVEPGTDLTPTAAVDGTPDTGAVWLPMSQEVELSVAPDIGAEVRWGGYFVVPARFDMAPGQGLEASINGFRADEAPFSVVSLPFDDPVPLVPGGSPYGHRLRENQGTAFELSARDAFLHEVDTGSACDAFLDDFEFYPTGGPHLLLLNTGPFTITVRDRFGSTVGDVPGNTRAWLFVKEDGSGNRTPILVG